MQCVCQDDGAWQMAVCTYLHTKGDNIIANFRKHLGGEDALSICCRLE